MSEDNRLDLLKKNKKFVLIGLFSLALFGGAITYGLNNADKTEPPKTAQSETTPKKDKKKQAWEKQVTGESENEKKKEKTTTDKVLAVIVGEDDSEDSRVFGKEIKKSKTPMLNKLAVAIDEQEQKVEARLSKRNVAEAAEIPRETKPSEKLGTDDRLPKLPGTDKEVEAPVIVGPKSPIEPTPPVKPVDPPVEKPEKPIDPPKPPVEPDNTAELTEKSKNELNAAKEKADNLNSDIRKVAEELEQLATIKEATEKSAEDIQRDLDKVAALILEYNALSAEIKQLIEVDGTVLPINYELYKETYEKLGQKVTEIQQVQQQTNTAVGDMENTVASAKYTSDEFENNKADFNNGTQKEVAQAKNEITTAVSTANDKPKVAENVASEVNAAETASNELTQTNNDVTEQFNKMDGETSQQAVSDAETTVQEVKEAVDTTSENVAAVVDDYQSLPTPASQEPPAESVQQPVSSTPVQQTNETQQITE
jgi:ABC-type transporter Mla subunit MlaD